jgi:hypothetical protein
MLEPRVLNTIGLALVFAGCLLLYHFGLPPDFDPTGACHLLLEKRDEAAIAKGKRYRFWGGIGVALIAIGSLFQLWATWVP